MSHHATCRSARLLSAPFVALADGLYDGEVTFAELKRHGDLGLGAVAASDGELVLHMHFLTADRKAGGHALAFRAERLRAAADACQAVHVALPRDRRFSAKDSAGVDRKEMDQILGRVPLGGEAPRPK